MKNINLKTPSLLFAVANFSISHAAIVVDLADESDGVHFTMVGAVDVSGMTSSTGGFTTNTFGTSETSIFINGSTTVNNMHSHSSMVTNIVNFAPSINGIDSPFLAPLKFISFASDQFIFLSPDLADPANPVDITVVIPNETFASLGIQENTLSTTTWNAGAGPQSATIRTGGAIPEPSSAILSLFAGLFILQNRRR